MMKKIIFLGSVLFMMSCGSEEAKDTVKHAEEHVKETAHKVEEKVEKHVEAVVEAVEEKVAEAFSGDAVAGEALFTEKGCVACHQVDTKTVGPSLKTIAEGYADNEAQMISFLKEEADAIIDPELFAVMQANLAMTKTMNDDELSALVAFVMSKK